jgi:hypothetical protein
MKKQYTPEPWHPSIVLDDRALTRIEGQEIRIDGKQTAIAKLVYYNKRDDEIKANARLIANAPLLFQLLKQAISLWENQIDGPDPESWTHKARAAIDRVTGTKDVEI